MIELLVVVAIIAILAGMLLPALNSARKKAVSINCISNLKSTGSLFLAYSNDYQGYFPAVKQGDTYMWSYALFLSGMLKKDFYKGSGKPMNIVVCPGIKPYYFTDQSFTYAIRSKCAEGAYIEENQAFRSEVQFSDTDQAGNEYKFPPSRFIMLMDSVLNRPGNANDGIQVNNVPLLGPGTYGNKYQIHLRHSRQANVWCADGSAKAVDKQTLLSTYQVNDPVVCNRKF